MGRGPATRAGGGWREAGGGALGRSQGPGSVVAGMWCAESTCHDEGCRLPSSQADRNEPALLMGFQERCARAWVEVWW